MPLLKTISAAVLLSVALAAANAQKSTAGHSAPAIPPANLIQITRAEDERRWDDDLKSLLASKEPAVRKRAALAAGRIGAVDAVPLLAEILLTDRDPGVREMAAFALGETELPGGVYALITVLKDPSRPGRPQSIEALGKIVAAMMNSAPAASQRAAGQEEDERLDVLKAEIVSTLRFELGRRPQDDRQTILLGLTAVLRSRPDGVGKLIVQFLDYPDTSIVATALNTMARLRLKDGNERVRQLLNNSDPIVRANAARVIGAAEHKEAFDDLLARALTDSDLRVRASAIRSLATLKDARAVEPLIKRGNLLLAARGKSESSLNELLEITATLGRLLPNSANQDAIAFLESMHRLTKGEAIEVEVALARIAPGVFQSERYRAEAARPGATWMQLSRRAQGLAAIKEVITGAAEGNAGDQALKLAQQELAIMLRNSKTPTLAVADILQAYASYKPADADEIARQRIESPDPVVRSAAAEILGGQVSEANTKALIAALPRALQDKDLNDAAMAILSALGKQKTTAANDAIKLALNSPDQLIRRRAVAVLKAGGAGDFSDRIGLVKTRNTDVDYRRALDRTGKKVTATVVTSKGSFTIEFLPADAPLTVDNFIQLARKGYFNGQRIPRVVPNFVIQAGDPRGDQNGGPGYSIRCEINQTPFVRASVGMALSGKDTGGSQWFVTHSPQPHLDGGYTVFGRVIRGIEVVDSIARGDTIQRVVVSEK